MAGNLPASMIIAVYRDTRALQLIFQALRAQSFRDFEVVVAEDGQSKAMKDLVSAVTDLRIVHTTQPDVGWRKNQSLNNAVRAASGEYLIFIDGDCIPHTRFVESHLHLAEPRAVVSGRRVMLDPTTSESLRSGILGSRDLERSFLRRLPGLLRRGARHCEEGLWFSPKGRFGFLTGRPMRDILGCNFAVPKRAMLEVNGFDEDYTQPCAGEDNDLRWRLEGVGVQLKSARNAAVQFHLHHAPSAERFGYSYELMRQKMEVGLYRCPNGLVKDGGLRHGKAK